MSKTNIIEVKVPCNYNEIGVLLALPYQISQVSFSVKYTMYEYDCDVLPVIEYYSVNGIYSNNKFYNITTQQENKILSYYEQDMDELNEQLEEAVRKYEESFFDSKEYADYLQGNY